MTDPWLEDLKRISASKESSGVPVYRRLLDALSAMAADGRLPDGTRLAPDSELAALLGISHITWAKVLNALAERGFAERSRKRGTFIRRPSRTSAMKEGKANAVACFMDDFDPLCCNEVFLETLQRELTAQGFRPAFISAAASSTVQYAQVVSTMQIREFCGALVWSLMDDAQVRELLRLRPADWPLIFMAGEHRPEETKRHDFVHYDNFDAGFRTAQRFLERGGKKFVCLLSEQHLYPSNFDRIRGIEQAVFKAGLPAKNVEICRIDREIDEDFEALSGRSADTLLVAAAPMEVRWLTREFRERQIAPAEQGAVIGFLPDGFTDADDPPFALCRFDTAELCREAVRCLIRRLKQPQAPPEIRLLPGIIDDKFFP